MKPSMFNGVNRLLNGVALKGLENAYKSAVAIKTIENKHFQGNMIGFESEKGKTVCDYFKTELNKELFKIRAGLTQFRFAGYFSKPSYSNHPNNSEALRVEAYNPLDYYNSEDLEPAVLEKLSFIESVVSRYRDRESQEIMEAQIISQQSSLKNANNGNNFPVSQATKDANEILIAKTKLERAKANESGSIFGVVSQIKKQMSPEYDQEIVKELRKLRRQERISLRWFALILIVPLIFQFVSKNVFFEPIFNNYRDAHPIVTLEINELSEKFFRELNFYKESLEVGEVLGRITIEEKEERIIEKTKELTREFSYEKLNGLKNLCADLVGLITFVLLAVIAKSKLSFLRSWFQRTFTSLNDVTKVFMFILLTDLFVGFHSVEGWEVILGGIAEHFGLPESRTFSNTFIATVPVIMDSCFKLWVFNYLTRSSPSAVAILEKMNQ